MVSDSRQDVSPALNPLALPLPVQVRALYVILIAIVLATAAALYMRQYLVLVALLSIPILGFFKVLQFQWLYGALLLLFFLISPVIPPMERHFSKPIGAGGVHLQDAVLLLLFAVTLRDWLRLPRPQETVRWTPTQKLFVFYSVVSIASLLYGVMQGNKPYYIFDDGRNFLYLSLFWVYGFYARRADGMRLEAIWRAFVLVACLFAAISFLDDALRRGFSRYNSGISFLLVPAALSVIATLVTEGMRTARSVQVVLLLVLLAGILITFTRGLYLGFAVGGVAMAVALGLRRSVKVMLWLGVLSLVVAAGAMALGLSFGKMLTLTTSRGEAVVGDLDVSSVERILEILAVIDEFPRHPLFGVGAGGTLTVYRFGDANVEEGMVDWWFIHNNYAHVLHKGGLIGLLAILLLWCGALWRAYQLYRIATMPIHKAQLLALIGSIVAFLTIALVTPVMTYINTNFFNALMFASLAVLERQVQHTAPPAVRHHHLPESNA